VCGIAFFASEKSYQRMLDAPDQQKEITKNPRWSLMFNAPDEMMAADAELWDQHGLRVAADDSTPALLRYRGKGKVDRPDGAMITVAEGLCRAIAASSEAVLDA